MATRFVATEECDAHPAYKEAYINAKAEDIGLIVSPVGLPGRALMNTFTESVENANEKSNTVTGVCWDVILKLPPTVLQMLWSLP